MRMVRHIHSLRWPCSWNMGYALSMHSTPALSSCSHLAAFLRSLSLHLLVCWDVHVGHCFFIVAQAIGWSAIIILSGITLGVTGVSFRFGDACHVNVNGSIPSFWGPLIIVSGSSALLQIITFAFGLNLYILKRAWWTEGHYQ